MNHNHFQSLYDNRDHASVFSLYREAGRTFNISSAGTSMLPLIQAGDELTIRLRGINNIRVGDVAAFFQNNQNEHQSVIVHRIIKKKMENGIQWYCQKGDNVPGWGWIPETAMIGIVESVQKKSKRLSLLSLRMRLINRIIGCVGWSLVTGVEKFHPIIVATGYHPSKDFPKIREKTIYFVNKILQRFFIT